MKKRLIGALFISLLGIPILFMGEPIFRIACTILACLSLKEFVSLEHHHKKIPLPIFLVGIVDLILFFLASTYQDYFLITRTITITFISLFLPSLFYKNDNYTAHEAIYLLGCTLFLMHLFNSICFIYDKNLWIFVYLLLIAIFTDTFAYLIGSKFGRHKSCPSISPNKTWEGCIGGLIIGTLLSSLFYLFVIGNVSVIVLMLITSILSILGMLGDLVFSKIKRENEIKDFSNLIPGHGGMLDRIDSLSFIVIGYILFIGII